MIVRPVHLSRLSCTSRHVHYVFGRVHARADSEMVLEETLTSSAMVDDEIEREKAIVHAVFGCLSGGYRVM